MFCYDALGQECVNTTRDPYSPVVIWKWTNSGELKDEDCLQSVLKEMEKDVII